MSQDPGRHPSTEPPTVIAFEGRCYRLDRIAMAQEEDVVVVRRKPYHAPVLLSLGHVKDITKGGSTLDDNARHKPQG